ncbi:MAG: YlxR family protein [Chloroflexi bacterium]|nr:YlxR family protein [Chloroflexota bacterium]
MSKKGKSRQRKHVPHRMCVVCRQTSEKRSLTRLVRTAEGEIHVDSTGKRNGRGAYLCDKPACWQAVLHNPDILGRALHLSISSEDRERIEAAMPEH